MFRNVMKLVENDNEVKEMHKKLRSIEVFEREVLVDELSKVKTLDFSTRRR